ncbi:polysaccharide biosynthesis/export family protein [Nitrospira sp. M1]
MRVCRGKGGSVVLIFLVFALCAGIGIGHAQDPAPDPEKRAEKRALIVTEEYIIGPEDVLEISVWKNTDLSREVVVRPDGRITLPLIGDVKAVGRTTQELREEITERLSAYKESPTIAIVVKAVNSYYYYVQGATGTSGKLPLLSRTTLVQAITLAGGLTPDAVRSRIVIFRIGVNGDGSDKLIVNYDDIILRGAENVVVKPGDTIVVPSETMVLLP